MEQHYVWRLLWLVYFGGVVLAITRPSVKLLEQSSNKLEFCIRATIFWGVEVFFAGIGLLFLLFTLTLTPVTALTCHRSALSPMSSITVQSTSNSADCELININWLGLEKSKLFISGLQSASLDDKELNSVTIRQRSWFGTKVIQHLLNEISDVKVEYTSGEGGLTFRASLILISGENLPLTWDYTSGFEDKKHLAVCIRSFLNLANSGVLST